MCFYCSHTICKSLSFCFYDTITLILIKDSEGKLNVAQGICNRTAGGSKRSCVNAHHIHLQTLSHSVKKQKKEKIASLFILLKQIVH